MTSKGFPFDLGRIMDEAFQFAQNIGETIDRETAEKMRRTAEGFGCGPFGNTDCYPTYLYPPATIYLTRDKKMVFEFALAGFDEKDISVQFRGDSLIFSARIPAAAAQAGRGAGRIDPVLQAQAEDAGRRGAALLRARRQVRPGRHAGGVQERAAAPGGSPRARAETAEEIRINIRSPGSPHGTT